MSVSRSLVKASGAVRAKQALQTRAFRYRGQADLDTAVPWYWLPMEAPNYSQLPESWDEYMWHGFGQEAYRFCTTPSGEHVTFGRRYVKGITILLVLLLGHGSIYLAWKIISFFRTEQDYYYHHRFMDFQKRPFDNGYLQFMGRADDPEYLRHINSKDTF
eukprot:Sspe_Gene.56156::Locus_30884_Transcript_4_4_Confidence_0.667_Length_1231::g.56156::m.56156